MLIKQYKTMNNIKRFNSYSVNENVDIPSQEEFDAMSPEEQKKLQYDVMSNRDLNLDDLMTIFDLSHKDKPSTPTYTHTPVPREPRPYNKPKPESTYRKPPRRKTKINPPNQIYTTKDPLPTREEMSNMPIDDLENVLNNSGLDIDTLEFIVNLHGEKKKRN